MTAEQFERWKDVSIRFARHGWPNMTEARKNRLETEVEAFFDQVADLDYSEVRAYDQGDGGWFVCDLIMDMFGQTWTYFPRGGNDVDMRHCKFLNQLTCCLRIGIDLAGEQSAGVLGFTKGDLERCFDGTIPDWILNEFEGDLAGVPPDAGVWL